MISNVLAVSGVVGAGKSTFINKMSKELNMTSMLEHAEADPLLPLMYEDPKRWAMTIQINFLRLKSQQLKEAMLRKNCFLERTLQENIIFTYNHYKDNNLTDIEWAVFNSMYNYFCDTSPVPDLMIFLDVSDELALHRIKERGILHEQGREDYFVKQNKVYREWLNSYAHPKVIINNDKFDYINNPMHVKQMTDYLNNFKISGVY